MLCNTAWSCRRVLLPNTCQDSAAKWFLSRYGLPATYWGMRSAHVDLCFQSVEVLSSLTFFFLVPLSTTSTTVAVSLTRISTCTTSRVAKALVAKVLCSTLFFFFF